MSSKPALKHTLATKGMYQVLHQSIIRFNDGLGVFLLIWAVQLSSALAAFLGADSGLMTSNPSSSDVRLWVLRMKSLIAMKMGGDCTAAIIVHPLRWDLNSERSLLSLKTAPESVPKSQRLFSCLYLNERTRFGSDI